MGREKFADITEKGEENCIILDASHVVPERDAIEIRIEPHDEEADVATAMLAMRKEAGRERFLALAGC
ncbi:MAG: hypothetical protein N2C14_00135 [Planctomycetales bacterium]